MFSSINNRQLENTVKDFAIHRQTCLLHEQAGMASCSGTLKRGRGSCANKATSPSVPRVMPTCKIHRDQLKVSGQCEAILTCGFECGQLFEWKPYGFQLCPEHNQFPKSCYFLKLPVEMRLRIYRFLLPDKAIPARYSTSRVLTSDGDKVYMAILRVNHQIHDEAAGFLYSTTAFTIELSGKNLQMCNSAMKISFHSMHPVQGGNHALQDYQMQLMLLEQQSKSRIMAARQAMYTIGESSSRPQLTRWNSVRIQTRSDAQILSTAVESIWRAPLSDPYFNMIRSFVVELVFPTSRGRQQMQMVSQRSEAEKHKLLESRLYDYCDDLHRLIGRLQLVPQRIAHLQIIVKFGNSYEEQDEAFAAAQLLIQPLRRLQNVEKLEIFSITISDLNSNELDLLATNMYARGADMSFADYLKTWSQEISSSEMSSEGHQVFEAYWQLQKLISSIRESTYFADPRFDQLTHLLHDARVAREAEDLPSFRSIWNQVIAIWFQYLHAQESFHVNVAHSIGLIDNIVAGEN